MKANPTLPALFGLALLALCAATLRAGDGSLAFDGTNGYVEVPAFQHLGVTNEVTVEFWAKANTIKTQSAFVLSPDVATNRFKANISDTNTSWEFGDIAAGGRVSLPSPASTVTNWTHYALVGSATGNFMKIYVNGAQVASSTNFNVFEATAAAALRIGGDTGSSFDGSLDDFRVWNVARTSADIQRDLAGPLIGNEPGLRLYFKFDENTGNTATNSATSTGAAFNGTLVGGTAWNTPARTTYVVTTTNDTGAGSLRQAVTDATTDSGPALITFAPALDGQTISLTDPDSDGAAIVLYDSGGLTIDATSLPAGLTIDDGTSNSFGLLGVWGETGITLRGLTLANGGNTSFGWFGAGAIHNTGTLSLDGCILTGSSEGGAIINGGTLYMANCTLSGNYTFNDGGGLRNWGGATARLVNCTLYGNTSDAYGGGIANFGTLSMANCTLYGNFAENLIGGGIYNDGVATLEHCTVSGNHSFVGAGIHNNGTLTLISSIVSENIGSILESDVINAENPSQPTATLTLVGASIVRFLLNADNGIILGSGNVSTASPLLAPLGDYGGPTLTMALLPGSPARNAAVGSTITSDQRGYPIIGTPDIGAYEAGTLNSYNTYIWESLPTAGNGTLADPLHDSAFDFDGDGASNFNEWLALTSPADPTSRLRVTQITRTSPNLTITFPSVLGRNYTFATSPDLVTWTPVATNVAGTGEPITMEFGPLPEATTSLFVKVLVGL